ncbi:MAG: ABC transporter substrate-binding protein, partial [Oscillospiraceae bacterium]|nr:ABC transporter substrate-binding protein [Oscillospiraceae bacterium]
SKLKTGGVNYDVIIPSDYMVGRLASEGYLEPLNFDHIPNYQYIDEDFKNTVYDPDNQYSVPYSWGTVGIIYNTKYVAEPTGWDALWNPDYAGKILMFDNSRDAFGIAESALGYSQNSTDPAELQACADKLAEQKPLVQSYVMDQIFDLMENEEAWIAPYYAGDYLTMASENEDLAWYLPDDESFNFFIDAMCIPTCCTQKEAAETFINFLCDPEISGGNMSWVGYGTPESEARQYLDEGMDNEIAYPDSAVLARSDTFKFLDDETNQRMNALWLSVKTAN